MIFQSGTTDKDIISKAGRKEKRNRKPDGGSRCEDLQGGFNSRPVQSGETLKINIAREVEKVTAKVEKEKNPFLREFHACPRCGRLIGSTKVSYFVCPKCGKALCAENELEKFDDNYCGNCGAEIANARKLALAEKDRIG